MQFNFDDREFIRFRNALHDYGRKGVPHAARNGLNRTVFEGRKVWHDNLDKTLTLRNTWTKRSIRYAKARGTNLFRLEATLGSTEEYMALQERGGVQRKKHKHGVPIPSPVASGEGRGVRPRKRMVRKPHRMENIQLARRRGLSSLPRRQRNAAAIQMAKREGRKHVFLRTENRKGLFKLSGGRRNPRIDLVWDLSKGTVRIPPSRTLASTVRDLMPRLPGFHVDALKDQLRRFHARGF